jgi:uncharacterized protein YyaL (SSP411 family)
MLSRGRFGLGISSRAPLVIFPALAMLLIGETKVNDYLGSRSENTEQKANKLVHERSPYLLQHAHNPVDWYPWGEEAFEKARRENKPVFLSIGYSTCHWCHVMAHESFEDPEVASLMNDAFVPVKVDREERPDVDHIYMAVCQMMTGSGGWPLTVIMTPDKKPFLAGTYFPKESRFGQTGLLELIPKIQGIWSERQGEVLTSADQITQALRQASGHSVSGEVDEATLGDAYRQLTERFDEVHGGFGAPPKFPIPHNLLFLLRYWKRTGEKKALQMVETTLRAMRMGGVYDHIGFGFHRYSTDAMWLLPHFEKMLYDQAMVAMAYVEAYQATGQKEYASTAGEIFSYVLRDMTSSKGAFYSAEDADSEGEEGKFYVWTQDQIEAVIGKEEGALVARVYNVERGGNFRDQPTGKRTGASILHIRKPLGEIESETGIFGEILERRLESARQRLLAAREKRPRPHRDDKVLADWNGLMIAALAKGAQVLDEPMYAGAASSAADFLLKEMRDADGRLYHRYREGKAGVGGVLDDYAFVIWGLLELYEAVFDVKYLDAAVELCGIMVEHFWDLEHGGFFFTADDGEELLVRKREIYDGATPSGNSVAMLDLIRLARITGNSAYDDRAAEIARAFSGTIVQSPSAHTQLLVALDFAIGPSFEVVVAGEPGRADTRAMLKTLRTQFVPNKVVLLRPAGADTPPIVQLAPFTEYQTAVEGKATAYVCRNYACDAPTTDPDKMRELLTMAR